MGMKEVKDLEAEEIAQQIDNDQARIAAYEKRLGEGGGGDFLNPITVKDKKIKIVKFTEYLGLKMTRFKPPIVNEDRPNFTCEVMVGGNVGAIYTASLTDASVRELQKQGMAGKPSKEWCGKPLDVSVSTGGKGDFIKYLIHVQL